MASTDILTRNEVTVRSEAVVPRRAEVRPHLFDALGLLLQAYDYAIELEQDTWELAVELDVLRGAKLTNSDLRWLVAKGYIEHAIETTCAEDRARHFRRTAVLTLNEGVCFVLTRNGAAVAREIFSSEAAVPVAEPRVGICQIVATDEVGGRPKWDHQRRQLRLGTELVKEFKLPSPNQETVLAAFEEEGWPPRIDDPLPPVAHLDSRRRLHDTIKALNRKQKRYLVRFRGDGSGEGIRWEPAAL
jgi:hypothetical protein